MPLTGDPDEAFVSSVCVKSCPVIDANGVLDVQCKTTRYVKTCNGGPHPYSSKSCNDLIISLTLN